MSEIQAVIFSKQKWNTQEAEHWLKTHHITPMKAVHRTLNFLRYRIREPATFKHFIIKKETNGIEFVIGFKSV